MKTFFQKLSAFIDSIYSVRLMQILLIITLWFFWLFNFSSLPISNPELIKISGQNGLLDLLPYYSAQEAFSAIESYQESGRELYVRFIIADFVFIVAYSLGFALLITFLVRKLCASKTVYLYLNLLPITIGFFDTLENLSIFYTIVNFPEPHFMLLSFASFATVSKHFFTLLSLLALGYGGAILFLNRFGMRVCKSN